MKKLLAASLLAVCSISAHADAFSDGIAAGILGTVIIDRIRGPQTVIIQQQVQPHVVEVLPPVYAYPIQPRLVCGMNVVCPQQRGRTCLQHPYHDQYGNLLGYQLSCH